MRYRPVIVISCLFGLAVSFAPLFNMAVFLKPLTDEFGWSRTQVSGGAAAANLTLAMVAPFIGRIIDRTGPRRLIIVSASGFAISLAAFAILPPVYPVYLILASFVGLAGAGTSPLGYLALVARCFDRRLGLALGVAMAGLGIGLALSPIVGSQLIAHLGVRGAFLSLACIGALAVPNALFVLREPKLLPGNTQPICPGDRQPAGVLRDVLEAPIFWLLAFSVFLMTIVAAGCAVHLIALLTDRGYSPTQAANTASAAGVALLVSRLAAGYLLDHTPVRVLAATTFVGGAAGAALLAGNAGGVGPVVAVVLVGFAQGTEGDVMAYAVRRCFRTDAYGLTYGLIFSAFTLGAFVGPVLMAQSLDQLGSYQPGLWILTCMALLAAFMVSLVRTPTGGRHAKPVV